jgi:hypothetical protein
MESLYDSNDAERLNNGNSVGHDQFSVPETHYQV